MSWIMVGVTAVSVGTSLWGASKSAKAAKKAGKAEAAVHNYNADMNELDAAYTDRQSAEGQYIMAEQRIRGISKIRAKTGKSGVTGVTPFEVEIEAVRIYNMNQEMYRKEMGVKADKYRRLAVLDRMKAAGAKEGAKFGAEAAWAQGIGQSAGAVGNYATYNLLAAG